MISSKQFSMSTLAFALSVIAFISPISAELHQHIRGDSLCETIPEIVQELFDWPEGSELTRSNRISPDSKCVRLANERSKDWYEQVISPEWRPPGEMELIYLAKEIMGADVVRVKYEVGDFEIQISQTSMVFTLLVIPQEDSSLGTNANDKIDFSRELARMIFNREGTRSTLQLEKVPVPDLNEKIIESSFSPDLVRTLSVDQSVFGRPIERPQVDEKSRYDVALNEQLDSKENDRWFESRFAWNYWFRNVYWWNDGKRVGFYFLKKEAGQLHMNYGSRPGWFDCDAESEAPASSKLH